jgi:hypothetical protein
MVKGQHNNWDELQARVHMKMLLDPCSMQDHQGCCQADQARRWLPPANKCSKPVRKNGRQHFVLHLAVSTALYGLCAVIWVLSLNGNSLLPVPDDSVCEHILHQGPSSCLACFLWAFLQLLSLLYLLYILTSPLTLLLPCLTCIHCLACKPLCCMTALRDNSYHLHMSTLSMLNILAATPALLPELHISRHLAPPLPTNSFVSATSVPGMLSVRNRPLSLILQACTGHDEEHFGTCAGTLCALAPAPRYNLCAAFESVGCVCADLRA